MKPALYLFAALFLAVSTTAAVVAADEAAGSAAAANPKADDVQVADDVQHIFYTAPEGLIVLRVHVRVDGESYRAVWEQFLNAVSADLDADDDGTVTPIEARKLFTRIELERIGLQLGPGLGGSAEVDSNPQDGKVTREELADYFERLGLRPFVLRVRPRLSRFRTEGRDDPASASDALFRRLDRNADQKLSADECREAASALAKLDLDEDGTISLAELQPFQNPYVASDGFNGRVQAAPVEFFLGDLTIVKLLAAYDGRRPAPSTKDNKLDRSEIGLSPEDFEPFDKDRDGSLDSEELRQLIASPPSQMELVLRLGRRESGQAPVEVIRTSKGLGSRVADSDGQKILNLAKVSLQIGVDSTVSPTPEAQVQLYRQQFQAADKDKNGYLDRKEVENTVFGDQFDLIDRDQDGKVFEQELIAYIKRSYAAARCQCSLSAVDLGRSLFQSLDDNNDNRLSSRELAAGISKIVRWDGDGDGLVAESEIPEQKRLTLERGVGGIPGVRFAPASQAYPGGPIGLIQPMRSPLWFQKMDVNRDGEVSRREFLGPLDAFDRLDKDRDGILTPEEAREAKDTQNQPTRE